eukprot:scaffold4477_cov417-Prasinococcus_capsulatus_cf.AAC.7
MEGCAGRKPRHPQAGRTSRPCPRPLFLLRPQCPSAALRKLAAYPPALPQPIRTHRPRTAEEPPCIALSTTCLD